MQEGDGVDFRFSHYTREMVPEQRPCWVTWAGEGVKSLVLRNLGRSALYGGSISGRGPRYCPSIEDKVVRFPEVARHQVFLEPEGLDTAELYVNGLSTSLPAEIQLAFLRTVPGLEEVRMTRAGYAIEYDYFPPHQLTRSLQVREIRGLFLAGQVNGTTGYEEAAAQGLMAGVNAALLSQGRGPFVLERDQAYIGVLIDDLITKGVDEPYRLFTSRAEFRLLLRQDNALERLGPLAGELGLLVPQQREALAEGLERIGRLRAWFRATAIPPDLANPVLLDAGDNPISEPTRAGELVKRPGVGAGALVEASGVTLAEAGIADALAAVEVELKYEGYITRESERAKRVREHADVRLAPDLPYRHFRTLSQEAREKLERIMPTNLAQAGRIPGVSPADVQNLMMEVRKLGGGGRGVGGWGPACG
jgi:tRNA uridine 5-carboxymethylaminomethyl modification enzyme